MEISETLTVDLFYPENVLFDNYCQEEWVKYKKNTPGIPNILEVILNNYSNQQRYLQNIHIPYSADALEVARNYTFYRNMNIQNDTMKGLWENKNSTEIPFKDFTFKNYADAISDYVYRNNINVCAWKKIHNLNIQYLDDIFAHIEPLDKPLTVFRKYSLSVDKFETPAYMSTSLSLSFINQTSFCATGEHPIYIRIDLLPGMKVLPLLNWEKWNTLIKTRFNPNEIIPITETQFEILLPRHANLHEINSSEIAYEKNESISIYSPNNPTGLIYPLPEIKHHFVVTSLHNVQYNLQYNAEFPQIVNFVGGTKLNMKKKIHITGKDKYDKNIELSQKIHFEIFKNHKKIKKEKKKNHNKKNHKTKNKNKNHDKNYKTKNNKNHHKKNKTKKK